MTNSKRVGVIVGRFQIAELHAGHRHLIDTAIKENNSVLILVGVHGGQPTDINPLSFELRKAMLNRIYPTVKVEAIHDVRSNEYWSNTLDQIVAQSMPGFVPVLYGSRDSFLKSYCGDINVVRFVKEIPNLSATKVRQMIEPVNSTDFLMGVIHATAKQRYPTAYQVIDVAVKHSIKDEILLGRKVGETGWRFAGGFVDPTDVSLEMTVRREVKEEMGDIEVDGIQYLGSRHIDDHRYHGSVDGVMSAFFLATYIFGRPQAQDDLDEVRWFPREEIMNHLILAHQPLGKMLLKNSQ